MEKIGIVTDGSCDIPQEYVDPYNLEIVEVHVNTEEGEPILLREKPFYEFLRTFKKRLFTSQPSVGQFVIAYEKLAKRYSSIISIHLTGARSGTIQSALIAKESLPDLDISVIDSKSTSLGLGLLVLEAARQVRLGKTKEEIIKLIYSLIPQIKTYAVLDTLEFALKGGRVDGIKLLIGNLLNLKPIIRFNDGLPIVIETIKGRKNSLDRALANFYKDIEKALQDWPKIRIGLAHADDTETLNMIINKIRNFKPDLEIIHNYAGPVLGTHSGPGAIGLFLVPTKD